MEDKKKFESTEEEPFELNEEGLENIAGSIEVPPPLAPPAPIGEGHLGEGGTNCSLFSTRNT